MSVSPVAPTDETRTRNDGPPASADPTVNDLLGPPGRGSVSGGRAGRCEGSCGVYTGSSGVASTTLRPMI